ncbi:MAG TPA: ankyrin repeat domain-containing protein [Gammaproteobacteria bacterium]|jgi:ankyrin repeat protein|nr:ankyrin repeat domain-containing protein [Gammaproteobacteria bacterium]
MHTRREADFINLLLNSTPEALRVALIRDPGLITARSDKGTTLLHHAVLMGKRDSKNTKAAKTILQVLFDTPGLDFTIKDNNGDTAMHIAAQACEKDRPMRQYIFPMLVQKAVECDFDFSTLGAAGKSVLHIAASNGCITLILSLSSHAGVNALSTTGATALYYAIAGAYPEAAMELLNAGANPMLCGNTAFDPFTTLELYLATFLREISSDSSNPKIQTYIQGTIDGFNELKEQMMTIKLATESTNNIKQSAKVLSQGVRTDALFLPDELIVKIAASTRNPRTHTEKEAEKIAAPHVNTKKR